MNKIVLAAACTFVFALSNAQNKEMRNIGSFTGIEVSKGANVTLQQDKNVSQNSLEIVTDGCPTADVETSIKNNVLVVKMKKKTAGSAVQVTVNFKDLNEIVVKRGASIETASGNALEHKGKLKLDVGAQSEVEMDIDVDELEVSANTCIVKLQGRADNQVVNIAGTVGDSRYEAEDLKSKTVQIKATETSSIVKFTDSLNAEAIHCTIKFEGDPTKVTKTERLGGKVIKN